MSTHSIANSVNIRAALLATVVFGMSPTAWSADMESEGV
jgi:hypothetical protein